MKRLFVWLLVVLLFCSTFIVAYAEPIDGDRYNYNGTSLPFRYHPESGISYGSVLEDFADSQYQGSPKIMLIVKVDNGYFLYHIYQSDGIYIDNQNIYMLNESIVGVYSYYPAEDPSYWTFEAGQPFPKDGFLCAIRSVVWSSTDIDFQGSVAITGDSYFIESAGEYVPNPDPEEDTLLEELLNRLVEILASVFVPDSEFIEEELNDFTDMLEMKFGVNTDVFKTLFDHEKPVDDVEGDYNIPGVGTFKLKFFDSSFFKEGVAYFRPLIRGFLVLMILLFHVKQIQSFFGYDAGVVTGRNEHIKSAKEKQE